MKLKTLLNKKISYVLLAYLIIYILFTIKFKQFEDIWWDSASYIGQAKFLSSYGQFGVFEPMKPLLLPLFLVIFIKIGLNVVFFGKILVLFASIGTLIFTYLISKEYFNENVAIFSVILTFCNPLILIFAFRLYTEMLTLCSILGALYFISIFRKNENKFNLLISGFFCAVAFIGKYPNLLLLGFFNLFLLYRFFKNRKISEIIILNFSFLIFILPFLILGYKFGGNYLYFLNESQIYFKSNLGHLYDLKTFPKIPKLLFTNTDFIYFKSIFYLINILLPFTIYGLFKIKNNRNYSKFITFIIFPTLLFFCFFEIFYLKQERYIIQIFPILAIISAYGLYKSGKRFLYIITIIYCIIGLTYSGVYLSNSYNGEKTYRDFFAFPPVNNDCKIVATSDPRSILKYDKLVFPYEVYDKNWSPKNLIMKKADCIFYYSCYENKDVQINNLNLLGYNTIYKKGDICQYIILKKEN